MIVSDEDESPIQVKVKKKKRVLFDETLLSDDDDFEGKIFWSSGQLEPSGPPLYK